MVLHTSLKELLKRKEELEDDLRRRYGKDLLYCHVP